MENNIKWTDKKILAGKTLPVAVLNLAVNTVLFRLGDSLLYALIPGNGVYTVAMWIYSAVSLAVSLLLSVKLLRFLCNKKLERMEPGEAEAHLYRESKFKWHVLFTVGLCFLVLTAVMLVCRGCLLSSGEEVPSPAAVMGCACVVILSAVLVIIGGKKLHWHMVQVTATNAELIDEVYCGIHDNKIPRGITRSDVISVLYCAAAYSVTTAAVVHVVTAVLKKSRKSGTEDIGDQRAHQFGFGADRRGCHGPLGRGRRSAHESVHGCGNPAKQRICRPNGSNRGSKKEGAVFLPTGGEGLQLQPQFLRRLPQKEPVYE